MTSTTRPPTPRNFWIRKAGGTYFSALDAENRLVGFFQFEKTDEAVDVGPGPDLAGRGLGPGFVLAGLQFVRERFSPRRFTLSLATFNGREICVYERAGLRRGGTYTHETKGGAHEFLSGWREA